MPTVFAHVKGVCGMTTTSPSRRERLRTATVAEIKDAARRLLVTGGPSAISLRAIARDMGMTAPAIYRYFPGLDALVGELCFDLYEELTAAIEAARDRAGAPDPGERLRAMARGFRDWSLAHPAEFALMFASPVASAEAAASDCDDADDPGVGLGDAFLAEFARLWRAGQFPLPPPEQIGDDLAERLGPFVAHHGPDLPLGVIYVFLTAWVRLYGLVAMEVFGQLHWAMTDAEPLFEAEIAAFVRQLTGR
jgi:AcrR family transcriptional regulator